MSNPSKMLAFGSFTQDETLSLLATFQKPKEEPVNTPNHSTALMFGSLRVTDDPKIGSPNIHHDKNEFVEKSATKPALSPAENGKVHDSNHCLPGNQELVEGSKLLAKHLPSEGDSKIDGKTPSKLLDDDVGNKSDGSNNESHRHSCFSFCF